MPWAKTKPGLLYNKRWDIQTITESDPEMKRGSDQEVKREVVDGGKACEKREEM